MIGEFKFSMAGLKASSFFVPDGLNSRFKGPEMCFPKSHEEHWCKNKREKIAIYVKIKVKKA